MSTDFPEKEINVSLTVDPSGQYTARILHHPTGTIKISAACDSQEEAVADALEGLSVLLKERIKGLGSS